MRPCWPVPLYAYEAFARAGLRMPPEEAQRTPGWVYCRDAWPMYLFRASLLAANASFEVVARAVFATDGAFEALQSVVLDDDAMARGTRAYLESIGAL